jgi:hypothetical protein
MKTSLTCPANLLVVFRERHIYIGIQSRRGVAPAEFSCIAVRNVSLSEGFAVRPHQTKKGLRFKVRGLSQHRASKSAFPGYGTLGSG